MGRLRDTTASYGVVVLVAGVMSYLSSRYIFVGSALNLLPWGVMAIAWGTSSTDKRLALRRGGLYGFCQSFLFLWIDKQDMSSVGQFLALCAIITGLGILAAGCAWLGALLGWHIRNFVSRRP